MKFSKQDIEKLNIEFEDKSPEEILNWAIDELHPNIALASSFQAQGVALIDILMKTKPNARIFTLDTGRLNKETYDVMEQIGTKYNTKIEVLFPKKNEVEEMVREHGINLFYKGIENRLLCCQIRKTNPLNKFLDTLDGWITSIRRNQTDKRANANKLEIDELHGGILKINPIVDWTEEMVWNYIRENEVPYNKLHDMNYPSIGCAPCTRPIKEGEDPRAGRWWWESGSSKECGIHFDHRK